MKLLIIAFITIAPHVLFAQDIEYIYDNAGNRVLRQVYFMRSNSNGDNQFKNNDTTSEALIDSTGTYSFTLFPNPTKNVLHIQVCEAFLELADKQVFVYDLAGKELDRKAVSDRITELDFSDRAPGYYIVRMLSGEKNVKEWKVIKE